MQDNRIKLAGLVAGVLVVVGVISLLTLTPAGRVTITNGVSADIGSVATGNVVVISDTDYQKLLDRLNQSIQVDETTRLTIIQEAISTVNSWK